MIIQNILICQYKENCLTEEYIKDYSPSSFTNIGATPVAAPLVFFRKSMINLILVHTNNKFNKNLAKLVTVLLKTSSSKIIWHE